MIYRPEKHEECKMIIYLAQEIMQEVNYNNLYIAEQEIAEKKAEKKGGYWWDYMPKCYGHEPRKSIIEDNKKMIRRLALKIESGVK